MSDIEDTKPGDVIETFSPSSKPDAFKWPKQPTHYPQKRPITLYSIEVGEDGDMPFFANPAPFRNSMN